jgi:hypothetical protein
VECGTFDTMSTKTESVKIESATVNKVRKQVKKTRQTIGGYVSIAVKEKLERDNQESTQKG